MIVCGRAETAREGVALALEAIRARPDLFLENSLHRLLGACNPADFGAVHFDPDYTAERVTGGIGKPENPESMLRIAYGLPRDTPFPSTAELAFWLNPHADSVAAKIGDKAKFTDGKVDAAGNPTSTGACTNPEAWLASSTSWKNKTAAERKDRAAQYVANCDKYTSNVKSGDTLKTLAIVSFAVAGAAAVGTIIYYFADSKRVEKTAARASERRIMVLPVYQPGFAGGLVTGTF